MAQEEIIKLLSEMVEIKSISSDRNYRDDVDTSAPVSYTHLTLPTKA